MSATVGRKPSLGGDPLDRDGLHINQNTTTTTTTTLPALLKNQRAISSTPTLGKGLDAEASTFVPGGAKEGCAPLLASSVSSMAQSSHQNVKDIMTSSVPTRSAAQISGDKTSTNTTKAEQAVSDYAADEARDKGIDPKDSRRMTQFRREYGLRPAFATPTANTKKQGTVITNFLGLDPPSRIWVYRLEMIRSRPPVSTSTVFVEKYADRMKLMPLIEQSVPELQPDNHGRKSWVTDGDLIWTTVNFLNGTTMGPAPLRHVLHNPALGNNLSYRNECGTLLTIPEVNICMAYTISLTIPMHQLFRYQANVPLRQSQPEILLRGLNAFLTSHARSQTQQTIFTGGKKAYELHNPHAHPPPQLEQNNIGGDLLRALRGFFLSARPGIDRLLVNINSVATPFFGLQQTLDTALSSGSFANMLPPKKSPLVEGLLVQLTFPFNGAGASGQSDLRFVRSVGPPGARCHRVGGTLAGTAISVHRCFLNNGPCPDGNRGTLATTLPATSPGAHLVRVAFNMRENPPPGGYETYPADVLRIVAYQPFHGTLAANATTAMINFAREDPGPSRIRILGAGMNMFGLQPPQQSGLSRFGGMSTGRDLLEIPATWLKAPTVRYYNQHNPNQTRDSAPHNASWNLTNIRFAQTSAKISELHYVNLSRLPDHAQPISNMRDNLRTKLWQHGILTNSTLAWQEIRTPAYPVTITGVAIASTPAFENDIARVLSQNRPMHTRTPLVVALPFESPAYYSYLKRVAELRLGISTVMFNTRGSDFNLQKASNIALKCNLKLSQAPHILPQSFRDLRPQGQGCNTIVIGADVTHPGKGAAPGCPSIAAIVGSTDDNFMHFPGSMRLQRNRKEYIIELGDMVKERLIDWAEKHGDRLPRNMLFYRDGVAETQYAKLRSFEMPHLQKAYNWAQEFLNSKQHGGSHNSILDATRDPWPPVANPSPPATNRTDPTEEDRFADHTGLNVNFKLTYMVVGKRHNTRFYATKDDDKIKPTGPGRQNHNIAPGLLVDQVITHPYNFDFYLHSHNPITGTGRSAHYTVLQNNMALTVAQLHEVTHDFCYTYARATKGVSYCAPAYYADRLCDRGRAYLYHYLSRSPHHGTPARVAATHTNLQHLDHVKDIIRDSHYFRPTVVAASSGPPSVGLTFAPTRKYGFARRNPWHANLDNVMFYL